jgi:hypothetical protein
MSEHATIKLRLDRAAPWLLLALLCTYAYFFPFSSNGGTGTFNGAASWKSGVVLFEDWPARGDSQFVGFVDAFGHIERTLLGIGRVPLLAEDRIDVVVRYAPPYQHRHEEEVVRALRAGISRLSTWDDLELALGRTPTDGWRTRPRRYVMWNNVCVVVLRLASPVLLLRVLCIVALPSKREREARRLERGECPSCGYPMPNRTTCPECGRSLTLLHTGTRCDSRSPGTRTP